ncbi:hypothetical protein HDU86_000650 [Geranomyces michiganensis]|nr:hypothetical protein HDU86_000650 [Geranomyces michiganensis]
MGFTALSITLATTGVACLASAAPNATPILPCLQAIPVSGGAQLLTPSDKAFPQALLGADYRFTFKPVAIYKPAAVDQISKAVRCAAAAGVAVAPRSGGHSYEGYSQGGVAGSLLIDLSKFADVTVDTSTNTAVVGPAVRLAPLYYKLWEAGQFVFPGGTCPTVGFGGLTLGGGFGMTGRAFGLALDQVKEMTVVTADGAVDTVSATHKPDVFFALRGAGGGSFGIVAAFKIDLQRAPAKVTSFSYSWESGDAAQVVAAYSAWGASNPSDKVTTELNWDSSGAVEIDGTYLGPKSDIRGLLKTLTDAAGAPPSDKDVREATYIDSALRWTWTDETDPATMLNPVAQDARYMKGSSILYSKPLSKATIDVMAKYLAKKPAGATAAYAIIDLWGGKVKNVAANATAFARRDTLFGIELVVEWGDFQSKPGKPDCAACIDWIKQFLLALVAQYRTEYGTQVVPAYQNYIDKNLPDWQHAYYGDNWANLVAIKGRTDPGNVFRFPQSIPVKL